MGFLGGSPQPPDGRIPARILGIEPEGIVEVPLRSGTEFECKFEGNPAPRITWTTGNNLDNIFTANI